MNTILDLKDWGWLLFGGVLTMVFAFLVLYYRAASVSIVHNKILTTRKLSYLSCIVLMVAAASCDSGKNNSRVKEPEAVVAQAVSGDTVVTFYNSARPYKLNQQINTQVKFVRNVEDSVGRFYLNEVYLNRKDSVIQRYEGAGNYKILPKPNGEVEGIAMYDMVLDDKSKGYMYLMKDSVTLVSVDDKGNELKGEDAVILKSSNKK